MMEYVIGKRDHARRCQALIRLQILKISVDDRLVINVHDYVKKSGYNVILFSIAIKFTKKG